MADWNSTLPGPAEEGAPTHISDHDAIVAAIQEARSVVDQALATIEALQTLVDGKADTSHAHDAEEITSGTFAAARIPPLSQGKVTGLVSALDGKADASALADLVTRVEALETPPAG